MLLLGLESLPGARTELERIAALGSHRILTGQQLNHDRVLRELPGGRVLHFATHALVNLAQPFQSYLALSNGGKLTVESIYGLRISADLVMLTACSSGSGRVSADGLLGFTRAFLYAGAASVVAPLWDIPDEPTVELVQEFYRQYQQGAKKSEALRAAQLKLLGELRAGRVSVSTPAGPMTLPEHPGLWAGFILQGAN
jgi:CHAT domain-containing protein